MSARHTGATPERIATVQTADLRSAARWFRGSLAGVRVDLFYARTAEGRVAFHRVSDG